MYILFLRVDVFTVRQGKKIIRQKWNIQEASAPLTILLVMHRVSMETNRWIKFSCKDTHKHHFFPVCQTHLLKSRIAMTMMMMRMTASTGPITHSISGSSVCRVTPLRGFTTMGSENGLAANVLCGERPRGRSRISSQSPPWPASCQLYHCVACVIFLQFCQPTLKHWKASAQTASWQPGVGGGGDRFGLWFRHNMIQKILSSVTSARRWKDEKKTGGPQTFLPPYQSKMIYPDNLVVSDDATVKWEICRSIIHSTVPLWVGPRLWMRLWTLLKAWRDRGITRLQQLLWVKAAKTIEERCSLKQCHPTVGFASFLIH